MSAIMMCAIFALGLNAVALKNKAMVAATLFIVMAAAVFAMPIEGTIFAFIGYISIEGALKIFSNYNPMIHVGQDIILGLIVLKSATDTSTHGVKKFYTIPGFGMVAVFLVWVFVQYFNPFGLGLLPSIAGTKIYVSMLFFFAVCYNHLSEKEFQDLYFLIVIIAAIQGTIAIFEYPPAGQQFMFGLHPMYRKLCSDRFIGVFYRPFGTGAVPGSPAIWISVAAPMAAYVRFSPGSSWLRKLIVLIYLGVGVPALIYCQVRTAMVTSVVSIMAVLFFPRGAIGKRLVTLVIAAAIVALFVIPKVESIFEEPDGGYITKNPTGKLGPAAEDSVRATVLRQRTLSLTKLDKYSEARSGSLTAMLNLSQYTIWGIGLSRTGAAAGPWVERIKSDPYYGPQWSFADNVYRAVFTDLGLVGLMTWVAMIVMFLGGALLYALDRDASQNNFLVWTAGIGALTLMVSAFGNEGPLYSPTNIVLWLNLAAGMRGRAYAK